jgi:predicted MPP superfamily phosphohydrolase
LRLKIIKLYHLKTGAFIIFVTIVTFIYGLVNSYIFIRGLQAIPAASPWRQYYIWGFWIIASTFIMARFLERIYPSLLTGIITWIGSFWLAFMLYFILAALLIDFGRLINHFSGIFPASFYVDYEKTKWVTLLITIVVVSILVIAGFINARTTRIQTLDIHISKVVQGEKTLKIVMASDIHMGTLIAKRKTDKLVNMINSLKPDIILFAGDVVDEDLTPVIKNNLGENLLKLQAKLGVYAIPGNHEYIGGAEPAIKYLEEHGITVLRDTALFIDNRFWLAGRDDRDKPRFSGKQRKELGTVLSTVDRTFPVILLDHQPFNLDQVASQGVDLQMSGHTHHGQLWPLNYVTSAIYEVSSGYKLKGDTHIYVSNGFGTWGPPVRLGNRPEIVQINVTFN